MIEIKIETVQGVSVVKIIGEIDATAAPEVQKQVLPLAIPGGKILLDMTQLAYLSSAGLRLLLSLYRQATANKSNIALAGVSEELKDTMSMTGFVTFFTIHDTLDAGVQAMSA